MNMIKNIIEKFKKNSIKKEIKYEKVCRCFNVDSDSIIKVVNEGAHSIKDVRTITKAGTSCGRCNASVERVTYKAIKNKGYISK